MLLIIVGASCFC
ncbi:sporulation protein YjcZ (plasmid) [Bacillus mycoides]|nr:sporulation protein YjcZ [Bacillus mycoides]